MMKNYLSLFTLLCFMVLTTKIGMAQSTYNEPLKMELQAVNTNITENNTQLILAHQMPKAGMKDAAMEGEFKRFFTRAKIKDFSKPLRIVIFYDDWKIIKNELTGSPEYKMLAADIAAKSKTDGKIYVHRMLLRKDYVGGENWTKTKLHNFLMGGMELLPENLYKE